MEIDCYRSPDAEALLTTAQERLTEQRPQRAATVDALAAAGFLAVAAALAAALPWHQALSLSTTILVVVVWSLVERVRFPVAGGWSWPTMLVFVPALFLLPTPVVPLAATAASLLRRAPDVIRGGARLSIVPALVANRWFTIGPVLVLVASGAQAFSWSHWPVYVVAFGAEVLFDMASALIVSCFGEGINPRVQLPLLTWVYLVDATLAPLGLLIAASTARRPGLLLLALPVVGLLWLFARERQQRLDQTLVLSSAYRGTALLLGEVIEADDAYTGIHSREVVDLALGVGAALGLDSTSRRNLEFTALLHDVGKIHVPKEVLNKPRRLDADEWKILHQHTIEGERMLRQVGGSLANVGQYVRSSHERYDGDGYPDRLAGDEIPIESRIVSVCDAFNAMTTDRPYRGAMSVAAALEELRREAGRQFDPDVVAAFESVVVSPPAESRSEPRVPGWVRIPEGQIERALKHLSAERQRREQVELAGGR
jgi:HD-GYP domain-containing protein (c-di-GMP phosphodiesterase class II)